MIMEKLSIWEGTYETMSKFPVFEGREEVDIVIVGGGITGITAALLLSNAGKQVLLLEAEKVGHGTTGHSTGNLYVTVDEHLSSIRRKWNTDVMKGVVESRTAAIELIKSNIVDYKIECDFNTQPFTLFAEKMTPEIEEFMQKEFDAFYDAGLNPSVLKHAGLPFETAVALQIRNQAQFHPLKYIQRLAEVVSNKCRIYENSRVIAVDDEKGLVITNRGSVKASKILLATHTPVGVHMIHTLIAPYREFGVAAVLNKGSFPSGIFWGMDEPRHSVRSFTKGEKQYVMVIGDKFKTGQHGDNKAYAEGLEHFLKDRLNVSETGYFWGGQQYRPADGLPYIGKHGNKVYFMTGFSSDGLTYGTLAAMIISDELLERSNAWKTLYDVERSAPLKSAKNFFKENAGVLVQYIKDMPWNVDASSLKEVSESEGKIIEHEGQKLAIYRDDDGIPHMVSAVCTHMKCIVNWNQSEKTWDCPCHGSRFDTDGNVIEGPAFDTLHGNVNN